MNCEICNSVFIPSEFPGVSTCRCDLNYKCLLCKKTKPCKQVNMRQHITAAGHIKLVRELVPVRLPQFVFPVDAIGAQPPLPAEPYCNHCSATSTSRAHRNRCSASTSS